MDMISNSAPVKDLARARSRHIIPDQQRDEVWDTPRKQELIGSILLGIKLPKFAFAETNDPEKWEVLDGQQRRAAILGFIDGKFSLSAATMRKLRLTKGMFRDLPEHLIERILNFQVEADQITNATEAEKWDYFQRLQFSMPLTASERLNAAHSEMRDFARSLSEHPFFKTSVGFENTRYAHFDVMSKAVAIAMGGLKVSTRLKDMLIQFDRNSRFSTSSPVAVNLQDTLDFLHRAFPRTAPELGDRSFVQSVVTLASQLVAGGESDGQEAAFAKFVRQFHAERTRQGKLSAANADADYVEFNASSRKRRLEAASLRHDTLVKKMGEAQPQLHARLAPRSGSSYWVVNSPSIAPDMPDAPASTMVMVSRSETLKTAYARRSQMTYPTWQRGRAWKNPHKQKLLDTIFHGWKLPKLYFNENGVADEVVDGQQRLSAIFAFMDGALDLSPETVAKFGLGGAKFKDLRENERAAFLNFRIEYDRISGATEAELKDVFLRLQQGKSLNAQEKLNAVVGPLRDYCKSLASHEFFRARLSFRNTRYTFFNIAAKMVATDMEGFGTDWEYATLKDLFERRQDFSATSPFAQHIDATFAFLLRAFPEKTPFREGPFVEYTATLASAFIKTGHGQGHEAAFGAFIKKFYDGYQSYKKDPLNGDQLYAQFGSTSADNRHGAAKASHDVLLIKMRALAPALAHAFDGGVAAPTPPTPAPAPLPPKPPAPVADEMAAAARAALAQAAPATDSLNREEFARRRLQPLLDSFAAQTPPVTTYAQAENIMRAQGVTSDNIAKAMGILSGSTPILIRRSEDTLVINPVALHLVLASGGKTSQVFADVLKGRNIKLNGAKPANGKAHANGNGSSNGNGAVAVAWEDVAKTFPTLAEVLSSKNIHGFDGLLAAIHPYWSDAASFYSRLAAAVQSKLPYNPSSGTLLPVINTIAMAISPNAPGDALFPEFAEARANFLAAKDERYKAFAELAGGYLIKAKAITTESLPRFMGGTSTSTVIPESLASALYQIVPGGVSAHKKLKVDALFAVMAGKSGLMKGDALSPDAAELLKLLKVPKDKITALTARLRGEPAAPALPAPPAPPVAEAAQAGLS